VYQLLPPVPLHPDVPKNLNAALYEPTLDGAIILKVSIYVPGVVYGVGSV
jgi:hypothetical protein